MEKVYEPINWENYPSIATPINEKNLNKMDSALDEVDNRVIGLNTAKLDKATANTMVKDISFNEETGIFTVTLLNGTVKTIDTKLEKIATNFKYDPETQKLLLTLVDGTEQKVDLSSLISQYEFTDSDYIIFEVGNDGKVKATIKSGSITEDMLQPNFLADVKVESEKAKSSANSASNSANEAKQYRDEAQQIKEEITAVTKVEIATTEKAGIVKPDGETITIDEDGKIRAKVSGVLDTLEEVEANEETNNTAGALALKEHSTDKENPHEVTAEQVGLGNVPNVTTDDQTPTYTPAENLATLTSGEKLNVAFGKIAKAISDFISHLSNKNNPHGVTAEQVGALSSADITMRFVEDDDVVQLKVGEEWIDWKSTNLQATYLYKDGVTYTALAKVSNNGTSGDTTFANAIILNASGTSANGRRQGVRTESLYDLTEVQKLYIDYAITSTTNARVFLGVSGNSVEDFFSGLQSKATTDAFSSPTAGTLELDVSAFSGNYYIYIGVLSSGTATVNISKIYHK